jgi:hypothetical protein
MAWIRNFCASNTAVLTSGADCACTLETKPDPNVDTIYIATADKRNANTVGAKTAQANIGLAIILERPESDLA